MTRTSRLDTFGVFSLTAEKKKDKHTEARTPIKEQSKRKSMKEAGLFQRFIAEETEAALAELAAEKAKKQLKLKEQDYRDEEYDSEDSASLHMN